MAKSINYTNPGHVIIFNTKYIKNFPDSTRHGSEKDLERLADLFT
jgi:hypothetical protein